VVLVEELVSGGGGAARAPVTRHVDEADAGKLGNAALHRDDDRLSAREAVVGRRSVRGYLPKAVPAATIRSILADAARAPSGTNSQPWFVHVVTGAARDRVSKAVLEAARSGALSAEYPYFPDEPGEPYQSRRRKVGFDLYALYGIDRKDMEGRKRVALKNFEFFGAPVGMFFSMERKMRYGSWLDLGMFMQNVMIVARYYGLESCPQQAWGNYGATVHKVLGLPDDRVMVSGMSLGYEDRAVVANTLVTEREPVDGFAVFLEE
jgi:nitroreductase